MNSHRILRLGFAGALLMIAAAGCGKPATESDRIVRLLEHPPEVRPAERAGEPPATLELADPTIILAGNGPEVRAADKPTEYGYDFRTGYYGAVGTGYRFTVEVGAGATLRTALSAWAPEGTDAPARFRVVVRDGRRGATLLDEIVNASAETRWRAVAVPLGDFAPGRVDIELSTEGDAATWAGWASPEVTWDAPHRRRPNLILISIDTLRADRLGCYGYTRFPTSPNLDAFAARSIRFSQAISQAPWTRPSHRAMFTGNYPSFVRGPEDFLANRLWREHYRTLGLAGGGQMDKRFGFASGFGTYQAEKWIRDPELVIRRIRDRPDRDLFLLLHSYEIHDPYIHRRFAESLPRGRVDETFGHKNLGRIRRQTTDEEIAYVSALYDSGIGYADEKLGELFELFERNGILDDSIIVITSDHGEAFWEHGFWRHGQDLYDTLVHVPLILWLPPDLRERFAPAFPAGAGPAVIEDQVGIIDLVPTLLAMLDLETPVGVQGRSLLPLLRGERLPERPLMSENLYLQKVQKYSLRSARYKFITPRTDRKTSPETIARIGSRLFDLLQDPGETVDLSARFPRLVERLQRDLEAVAGGGQSEEATDQVPTDDEKLRKELEALGYVGG